MPQILSPANAGGHLSSLFVRCFLLLICSSCCCFFWLLSYLLITPWPFRCWAFLSPVANFRCYFPFSDYKVNKCSASKNVGQEYIWLSIIHSHMQLVAHRFSQCRLLFSHIMIPWLEEKKRADAGAGELKKKKIEKGDCRIWCSPKHIYYEIKIVHLWEL